MQSCIRSAFNLTKMKTNLPEEVLKLMFKMQIQSLILHEFVETALHFLFVVYRINCWKIVLIKGAMNIYYQKTNEYVTFLLQFFTDIV